MRTQHILFLLKIKISKIVDFCLSKSKQVLFPIFPDQLKVQGFVASQNGQTLTVKAFVDGKEVDANAFFVDVLGGTSY